ncbi:MAG: DUF2569 domain-containing protein [Chlorobi bacterium]|nr:DUF2569 domain-containing protein [Chlorobiota bacterium]
MVKKEISTKTLGGWLIPIQIFIILNAISWVRNLQIFYGLLGEKEVLIKSQNITDPEKYFTFIYYELAVSLIFTFLSFVLFYYFFKRNKYFPLMMTIFLITEVIAESLSFILFGSLIPVQEIVIQKLAFSSVIAIIIIVYLKVSKRVKLTFIH